MMSRNQFKMILAAFPVFLVVTQSAYPAVDTLRGSTEIEDAGIRSTATGNNCGACSPILLDNNTLRKMFIRVKSWGSVPSGATIDACTLVTVLDVAPSSDKTCGVYECLRDWGVGTGNDVAASLGEDAVTWTKYGGDGETDFNWGTAGCQSTSTDRSGTAMSSVTVGSTDPGGTVYKFPITTSLAQAWRSGDNDGLVLGATASGVFSFRSTENAAEANRPYFIVAFTQSERISGNLRQQGSRLSIRQGGARVSRRYP